MSSVDNDFSFIKKLNREMDLWLSESLISPEQKDGILARYAMLKEADEKVGSGKLVTTITVLGSVLVGLGILLFVASNWSEIPRWGKLSAIFCSLFVSYGLGFTLRYEKQNYPKAGAALILLGCIIFGAGIFLIAQIYHITVHYPNGPLLWGLAVLPLAYLLRLKTILTLALIDLLVWLGMEASFPISAFYFSGIVPFAVLYLMAGIALWGIGLVHRAVPTLKVIAGPYVLSGLFITLSTWLVLSFDVFKEPLGALELMPFYVGIAVLYLFSVLPSFVMKKSEKGRLPEMAAMFTVMAAAIILSLLFKTGNGAPFYRARFESTAGIMMLMSNLVYFLAIIGVTGSTGSRSATRSCSAPCRWTRVTFSAEITFS